MHLAIRPSSTIVIVRGAQAAFMAIFSTFRGPQRPRSEQVPPIPLQVVHS